MTTSGTQSFILNTTQICTDALELLQVSAFGQNPTQDDMEKTQRTLNELITAWRAKYKLILNSEWISVPLTASSVVIDGGYDYECVRNHIASIDNQPSSPTGINFWKRIGTTTGAAWADGTTYTSICNPVLDINIVGVGRGFTRTNIGGQFQDTYLKTDVVTGDYFYLGNKGTVGKPIQLHFRRREDNSVFLYPYPPDTTTYQINLEVYRRVDDMTDPDNDPDFQAEWIQAIVYNLAVAVHPKFETKTAAQLANLKNLAQEALDDALSLDEEAGDIVFVPRAGYGKRWY